MGWTQQISKVVGFGPKVPVEFDASGCATCFAGGAEPYKLDLVRMQLSANIQVFTETNKVRCDTSSCHSFSKSFDIRWTDFCVICCESLYTLSSNRQLLSSDTVWRVRGDVTGAVLCCVVYDSFAQNRCAGLFVCFFFTILTVSILYLFCVCMYLDILY